jgi:hypothetical protein
VVRHTVWPDNSKIINAANAGPQLYDDMNRYLLQIKGLEAGKYAVEIDGKKIAEYSAQEST